nr:ABC transporter permease [Haloarcula sp. CK38]
MRGRIATRFPSLKMAYRNLSRTKIRSMLATLGIIIGVVAIASLGVFGVTLKASVTGNLGDIGNQVIVSPSNENGVTELTNRDIQQIRRTSSTATVTPMKQRVEPVDFGDGATRRQVLLGVEQPGRIYDASEGRMPDPLRSGVLIGESVAEEHDLSPGSTITINGSQERVKAVITSAGSGIFSIPQTVSSPRRRASRGATTRSSSARRTGKRQTTLRSPSGRHSTSDKSELPSRSCRRSSTRYAASSTRSTCSCWVSGLSRYWWPPSLSST